MSAFYRCDNPACGKVLPAEQPNRYTTMPRRWWWRQKTEIEPQLHVCSEECLVKVSPKFTEWKQVAGDYKPTMRDPAKECIPCGQIRRKAERLGYEPRPCLFHRKGDK